jgi:nucleoside-diphosphate-sugar epimerase
MAEILITGGAGNFGRLLASELKKDGHSLRILDLPSCDYDFFDGWEKTDIFKGDILDSNFLEEPLKGVEWVYHLAAILPPASEQNRELTFKVNVEGTKSLLDACNKMERSPTIVFSSSISIYGNAGGNTINTESPLNPIDIYAESKVEAEKVLFDSGLPYVNFRIAGIAIPAFLDPPEPWPFMAEQQIELLTLSDLVTALVSVLNNKEDALNKTLILSGGSTWQVKGKEYVRRWGEIMEIPVEEMDFMDKPGWYNWYDTEESQGLLDYQKTTLDDFWVQLKDAVDEILG